MKATVALAASWEGLVGEVVGMLQQEALVPQQGVVGMLLMNVDCASYLPCDTIPV